MSTKVEVVHVQVKFIVGEKCAVTERNRLVKECANYFFVDEECAAAERNQLVKKCANYFLFLFSLDRYSHRDFHWSK
jgi:hypothetical protein